MSFLKKTTALSPKTLVQVLHQRLGGYLPARSHKTVHASAVTSDYKPFCPREYALLDVTGKKQRDEYIDPATRVAFDIGDEYSNLCRNVWLRDVVVGDWQCRVCNSQVKFQKAPAFSCQCGSKLWDYSEVRIESKVSGISGGIDLIIDIGRPKYVLIEVKSIDKDEFKTLVAPKGEHRVRTELYLNLVEESEEVFKSKLESSFAWILYISKGYGKKSPEEGVISPFREFVVKRGGSTASVERCTSLAKALRDFRLKGGHLPKGICPSALDQRAVKCPVKKECFSSEFAGFFLEKE